MVDPSDALPGHRKVLVVGLIGGVASGKSRIAGEFAAQGAVVIDADKLGHEILQRPLVVQQLTHWFGEEILNCSGQINRRRLGEVVFADSDSSHAGKPARLERLERLTHPLIRLEAERKLLEYQRRIPPPAAIILDAPLLLEAKWEMLCDLILFVDTPAETRLARATARGWSEAQFQLREQQQMSLEQKRRAATHILPGTLDEHQLRREVVQLLLACTRASGR